MTKKFKLIIKYSLSVVFLSIFLALAPITADFSITNQARAESGWWQRVNDGGLNQVGQAYDGSTPRDISSATRGRIVLRKPGRTASAWSRSIPK